jgi:NADH-quinone oxidoreductase subunit M
MWRFMNSVSPLTCLTCLPLAGGLVALCVGARNPALARRLALGFSFAALGLALVLWRRFDSGATDFQFPERHDWIPSLAVEYRLGLDGLGLLMVVLSAIVVAMALLASCAIESPLFSFLVLLLEAGLFGTFTALNFFHWFLFWELSLVPAFFLIKLWGGAGRTYAATQFFLYTMVGSVALLLAFLVVYSATQTFDFAKLAELGRSGALTGALAAKFGYDVAAARGVAMLLFAGAFLGFAVKIPVVPFHTWLPTAYAEAPTGVTMLLTGAMSKMGVYGLLRLVLPVFPDQLRAALTPLLWLAVLTIVFSAGAAIAQRDLKRMLSYSSINHLGYCLLGILAAASSGTTVLAPGVERAAALNGVFLQMFNHGLTASALFWFVGFLEQRGGGLRGVDDYGGLRRVAPVFCGLMGIALFSSMGLPGLNGFIGEFLIFKGAFPLASWAVALSVLGLLLTAVFILSLLQRVFNGPLNEKWSALPDLTLAERIAILPPIALMFVLGVYPQLMVGVVSSTVGRMVENLRF